MKILLADDTEINRLYLSEALAALGAQVRTAVDGLDALQRASAECFDLLVLDIRMPQHFGDEVLQLLRARPLAASHASPAIAVSSEMDSALASRLCAEGFVAALSKPVQAQALLAAAGLAPAAAALADPQAALSSLQQLDDVQAVRALGNADIVARLRPMLAAELRARWPQLVAAVQAQQAQDIREWIHQMRASCALCGATRMDRQLLALREQVLLADWPAVTCALRRLETIVDDLLPLLEPMA